MKLDHCFTRNKILLLAIAAVVAVGLGFGLDWWYEQPTPNQVPWSVSFMFEYEHSGWPSPGTTAYQEKEPIIAHGYINKDAADAPLPNMYGGWGKGYIHPFTLIARDPNNLVYRWENRLSHDQYLKEIELWQTKAHGIHFDFDLRDWVPEGFQWKAGLYSVSGLCRAAGRQIDIRGHSFFMKEVPATFRNAPPGTNPAKLFKPMLSARIDADKPSYNSGDIITLRGRLKNISSEPFMVQTGYPFLEARLIAQPGQDFFPNFKCSGSLRLSDFNRIGPGQEILFFEESFVAGKSDPHWGTGCRWEDFPTPFAGQNYSIWLEMESAGLFPSDRQPDIGIWTGQVKSNTVSILISSTSAAK